MERKGWSSRLRAEKLARPTPGSNGPLRHTTQACSGRALIRRVLKPFWQMSLRAHAVPSGHATTTDKGNSDHFVMVWVLLIRHGLVMGTLNPGIRSGAASITFWLLGALIALVGAVCHGWIGGRIYMRNISASDLQSLTQSLSLVSGPVVNSVCESVVEISFPA